MESTRFKLNVLALGVSLACASFSACAAEEDQPSDDTASTKLQTVSVTGEKDKGFKTKYVQVGAFRDQDILDVPLTVNVIPRALLEAQNAQSLFDALKNAAGVARAQTNGSVTDSLSIRGITVEARTNYRLNGSLPLNTLIDTPLENKERIEALKGSSALYYGFSSPAGIVNLVTKRARDQPNASISVEGNEYGQAVAAIDVGTKFGDHKQFGARFNAAGGRLRNVTDGFYGNRSFGSMALDWRATDDLTFNFDFEAIHKDAIENAGIALLPAVNNKITLPRIMDNSKLISGTWAHFDATAQNILLKTTYTLSDNWVAVLETGRAETNRAARSFASMQNYNVVTGEGTLRTSLVNGQKYLNENVRAEVTGRMVWGWLDQELTIGAMQNKRSQNGPTAQAVTTTQNMYEPRVIPQPIKTQAVTYSPQDIKDKGVYVFDRIRVTPTVQFLVGARNSDYSNVTPTSTYLVSKTSPSAGVIYRVRPDTSIYSTYIEGIEETGTASPTTKNAYAVLPPAVSKQKELGIRSEAIKDVSMTLAYFTIDRASAYVNSDNFFVLDGRAAYKGLEFSANGSLTKQVSMYVSGLLLQDEQKKASNAALIGKELENTAKRSGSVFLEYNPDALPGFSLNGGIFYISKRAVNNLNQAYIPGYSIFTAGARYRTKIDGHPASFQVNVENLGDKSYWSAAGGSLLAAGMPRALKMNVKIDY